MNAFTILGGVNRLKPKIFLVRMEEAQWEIEETVE